MEIINYIYQNLGTVVVLLAVSALVFVLAFKLIRDKKAGKSSCSCGCASCPMSKSCHAASEKHISSEKK